jgi:hypothetical protein
MLVISAYIVTGTTTTRDQNRTKSQPFASKEKPAAAAPQSHPQQHNLIVFALAHLEQIPSTIQQLAFPAQTPVARREHTSSLTWKKEMLTVALGQTPKRDQGSQKKKEPTCTAKLQELRTRKSKPALPNSKSFAEERANVHCQTPKALQKSKP